MSYLNSVPVSKKKRALDGKGEKMRMWEEANHFMLKGSPHFTALLYFTFKLRINM